MPGPARTVDQPVPKSDMTLVLIRRQSVLSPYIWGPFLLAGCSLAPSHVRPPQPVPRNFAVVDGTDAPSVARIGWYDFFREEHLRQLITAAIENNRDIRIAAARVAQARAAWRIEGAALYPELDAVGAGTRGRSVVSFPGLGTQAYDIKQVTAQLSAGWEIDFWGRLRNLKEAARNDYLATEEARRAVATDLIAQIANGYLLEREYEEREALARQTIATRADSLRILRRRYEVGSGSKLEMTQAQMLLPGRDGVARARSGSRREPQCTGSSGRSAGGDRAGPFGAGANGARDHASAGPAFRTAGQPAGRCGR